MQLGSVIARRAMRTLVAALLLVAPGCSSSVTEQGVGSDAQATRAPTSTTSAGSTAHLPPAAALDVQITQSRYGALVAQTAPGARCSASARLPSGRTSTAQGLDAEPVADGSGRVSWSYGTTGNTNPGTGTHTVTCSFQGRSKTATAAFRV
jgi:hypothetical protein